MKGLIPLLLFTCTAVASDFTEQWRAAIEQNDVNYLASVLAQQTDPDLRGPRNKSALMASAMAGDVALTQQLLEAGAGVDACNIACGTPLMYVAKTGSVETASLLINANAEIDKQAHNGWTALMMAAAKNHAGLVELFLRKGSDANLPDVYGWTPIMRAAHSGNVEAVSVLISHTATDINQYNDKGHTVLHLAVIAGHVEVVSALVKAGAKQTQDFSEETPQSIARSLGREDLNALLGLGDAKAE